MECLVVFDVQEQETFVGNARTALEGSLFADMGL